MSLDFLQVVEVDGVSHDLVALPVQTCDHEPGCKRCHATRFDVHLNGVEVGFLERCTDGPTWCVNPTEGDLTGAPTLAASVQLGVAAFASSVFRQTQE